jgi:hypothetical protein
MKAATSTQVKPLETPLRVGDKVRFSIWMRPLKMVEGIVTKTYTAAPDRRNWFYEVEYQFAGRACYDKIDHTDPTVYKVG